MFEHIHFTEISFDKPADSADAAEYLDKTGMLSVSRPFADFYTAHASEVDFALEGYGKTFFPSPTSSSAREQFLYLQVFSLLDAGKHYYTCRRNYESFLLIYTYAGEGTLVYQGQTYVLGEGMGFLIDCQNPHTYYTSGQHWYTSMLHFFGSRASWYYEQFLQNDSVVFSVPKNGALQQNLEALLLVAQSSSSHREARFSLLLEKLLLDLAEDLPGRQQPIPDYIFYLQKYMENHFTQPFTLDDLASFANVSKFHLSREFKRHTGFSPNEYLVELRLDRAKFLLKNSSLPIGQTAAIAGFSSYPNFLKLFKERTGMTPGAYRG